MTHLRGQTLVEKTHPRILFRGKIDTLEGEILLCQQTVQAQGCEKLVSELQETLDFVRRCIRFDVLEEPVGELRLCGLDGDQLRERSHFPGKYYGQEHFLPAVEDGPVILALNRVRTQVRETELAACAAFLPGREDIVQGLNRLSSLFWILMIRAKAGEYGR